MANPDDVWGASPFYQKPPSMPRTAGTQRQSDNRDLRQRISRVLDEVDRLRQELIDIEQELK